MIKTEAMTLADKIVVLRSGRIEQVGSPFDLYHDPDNLFVAGFIGSPKMNIISAKFEEGALVIGEQRMPTSVPQALPARGELQLGIRPEHIRPARTGEPALEMTVDFTEFLGGATYLYGHLGRGLPLVVQGGTGPVANIGQTISVSFDPDDARFFDKQGLRIRASSGHI